MKFLIKYFLPLMPYSLVFTSSIFNPSDPDLGWHLKYGEYFFKNGTILRENTFSTMMPDFRWGNVSWGTDLITYAAYIVGGFLGLSILGALIVTLTFYFFSRGARLTVWDQTLLFPLLLYIESPINSVSFRGQQISLLFIGVLFYILSRYEEKPKLIYATIPLFLLWVNLHGQFVFGLGILSVFIVLKVGFYLVNKINKTDFLKSLKHNFSMRKKEILIMFGILISSYLVTLINPFGVRLHTDALAHFGSPLLKNVGEYLPFEFRSGAWWNYILVAVIITGGLIYLYFKRKLFNDLPLLMSGILFFVLAFSVRRFAWPAYYLILPLLKPVAGFIKPDKKRIENATAFIILLFTLILIVFSKLPFDNITDYSWKEYCQQPIIRCSEDSAKFLIENNLTDNLYTLYAWGGFLIWNYPEIKPSIDGRMHIWRDEKGYSGFEEYYDYEQGVTNIDDSNYNVVYMSPIKPIYEMMINLVNQGKWDLVYQDNYAGIFVRKMNLDNEDAL